MAHVNKAYRIECAEIWGGVENIGADLRTNGIEVSIYSRSSDGMAGGDIYYFSVCNHDVLTRIMLADLQGHGIEVTQLSRWIYDILREKHRQSRRAIRVCVAQNLLLHKQVTEGFRSGDLLPENRTKLIMISYDRKGEGCQGANIVRQRS